MDNNKLPFGETVNYWQTSKLSPDSWIDNTRDLIDGMGGRVLQEAYGSDDSGRSAYMLAFEIKGERYKVIWPVLPSRSGNKKAAQRQAATLLYHDVKARCLSSVVLGIKVAFFSYLLLPDGRTAAQASLPELAAGVPSLFASPQLRAGGEVVDGEVN